MALFCRFMQKIVNGMTIEVFRLQIDFSSSSRLQQAYCRLYFLLYYSHRHDTYIYKNVIIIFTNENKLKGIFLHFHSLPIPFLSLKGNRKSLNQKIKSKKEEEEGCDVIIAFIYCFLLLTFHRTSKIKIKKNPHEHKK